MKEQFSKIPSNTFQQIGINAAMILKNFNPATGAYNMSDLIGATTGGIQFNAAAEYIDFGEDIDNCPKNTKELKRLDDWTVTASGTFVTITPELAEWLAAAADNTSGHIVPRGVIESGDFRDLWIVGDYSNKNTGNGAGFIAIHLMNALSTGGFQIQTEDKGKMQFSFEFTCHYSMDAQDTVPFEIYIQQGTDAPGISLNTSRMTIKVGDAVPLHANVYPSGTTVTWASSATSVATVAGGTVTGAAVGYTIITASITVSSTTYKDICTVEVQAAT